MTLKGTTRATIEGAQVVAAATAIPLTVIFPGPHNNTRPTALPAMSLISKVKGLTMAEIVVLSNKIRIAAQADVIK